MSTFDPRPKQAEVLDYTGGTMGVAAVPGGTMSNVVTHLGRGNIALSIALTGVTTIGALVTTPLILRIFVGDFLPPNFEMPVAAARYGRCRPNLPVYTSN